VEDGETQSRHFMLSPIPRSHSLVTFLDGPIFEHEPTCPFYAPRTTQRKKKNAPRRTTPFETLRIAGKRTA